MSHRCPRSHAELGRPTAPRCRRHLQGAGGQRNESREWSRPKALPGAVLPSPYTMWRRGTPPRIDEWNHMHANSIDRRSTSTAAYSACIAGTGEPDAVHAPRRVLAACFGAPKCSAGLTLRSQWRHGTACSRSRASPRFGQPIRPSHILAGGSRALTVRIQSNRLDRNRSCRRTRQRIAGHRSAGFAGHAAARQRHALQQAGVGKRPGSRCLPGALTLYDERRWSHGVGLARRVRRTPRPAVHAALVAAGPRGRRRSNRRPLVAARRLARIGGAVAPSLCGDRLDPEPPRPWSPPGASRGSSIACRATIEAGRMHRPRQSRSACSLSRLGPALVPSLPGIGARVCFRLFVTPGSRRLDHSRHTSVVARRITAQSAPASPLPSRSHGQHW